MSEVTVITKTTFEGYEFTVFYRNGKRTYHIEIDNMVIYAKSAVCNLHDSCHTLDVRKDNTLVATLTLDNGQQVVDWLDEHEIETTVKDITN
jgi:hypothetical protein